MKKTVSMIFFILLCTIISISAYADLENTTPSFIVGYIGPSGEAVTAPDETLVFRSVPAASNPASVNIDFGTQTRNGAEIMVPIMLSNYSIPGIYSYTIAQTEGSTLGVSYDTVPIIFCVLAGYEENGSQIKVLQTGAGRPEEGGDKKSGFTNTCSNIGYGSLTVTNTVTGNIGDRQKPFTVTVIFTAPEGKSIAENITYIDPEDNINKTISASSWAVPTGGTAKAASVSIRLKNAQTVTFSNIPAGVAYAVSQTSESGYTLEYGGESGTINANTTASANFTNSSIGSLGTGLFLQRTSYILVLVLGIVGLVLLLRGKRKRGF
jgi:hypothetical protein